MEHNPLIIKELQINRVMQIRPGSKEPKPLKTSRVPALKPSIVTVLNSYWVKELKSLIFQDSKC
jgi:hypothetical protein